MFEDNYDTGWGDPDRFIPEHLVRDGPDDWVPRVRDALDGVREVADLMSVFAADRLVRVDALRVDAEERAARKARARVEREAAERAAGEAPRPPDVRGGGPREVLARSVRLELAAALRVTEHHAGMLLARAEAVVHRYPVVLDALSGARITERHADLLVDGLESLEEELRAGVLPRAVELAEALPVGSFRRALRALIDAARTVTLAVRHEEAVTRRRVVIERSEDGMSWLQVFLPAVEAHAVFERVTAIAKAHAGVDGEARSLDQLRADVLADLLIEGNTDVHPPHARGIRASVVVTVPALTLLNRAGSADADADATDADADAVVGAGAVGAGSAGAADAAPASVDARSTEARSIEVTGVDGAAAGASTDGTAADVTARTTTGGGAAAGDPTCTTTGGGTAAAGASGTVPPGRPGFAVVEGVGPIPIDTARELCGGAEGWMRVLTHPETGMVLSVGRDQYRPPAALRRLVKWRADRCMAPGCGVPASRCQIDHGIDWQLGGQTALWNLGPLCTGHHIVKHHGDWSIRHLDGGAIEWTSPTGRQYIVQPERRIPVFTTTDIGAPTHAPF